MFHAPLRSDHIDTPWADAEYDMRKRSAFLDMKDPADRKALFEKHIASLAKKMGVTTANKAQGSSDENASSSQAAAASSAAVEEGKPKEEGEEEDGEEKDDDDEEEPQGNEAPEAANDKKRTLSDSKDSEATKKSKK